MIDENEWIKLHLDLTSDQNKMLNAALNNRYTYAKYRKTILNNVKIELVSEIRNKNIKFDYPGKMHFLFVVKNFRRDGDNILSAALKGILDAMQQVKDMDGNIFLPNDSLKFINGFPVNFIVDKTIKEPYVLIRFEHREILTDARQYRFGEY